MAWQVNNLYIRIKLKVQIPNRTDNLIAIDYTIMLSTNLIQKIQKNIPDYQNDKSFGGNKKYIRLDQDGDELKWSYINPYINKYIQNHANDDSDDSDDDDDDDGIICSHTMNENVADKLQYFNTLIDKQIISIGQLYDLADPKFIKKILKTKKNITIEHYDEFVKTHIIANHFDYDETSKSIRTLFYCDIIINSDRHATSFHEDYTFRPSKNHLRIDVGTHRYIAVSLYKFNKKYYDESYLRKYIPYLIRWDDNNNYYMLNRDYEYIGLNTHSIDYNIKGQCYLFNGNTPWHNTKNYADFTNKYNKTLNDNSLQKCLNPPNHLMQYNL